MIEEASTHKNREEERHSSGCACADEEQLPHKTSQNFLNGNFSKSANVTKHQPACSWLLLGKHAFSSATCVFSFSSQPFLV